MKILTKIGILATVGLLFTSFAMGIECDHDQPDGGYTVKTKRDSKGLNTVAVSFYKGASYKPFDIIVGTKMSCEFDKKDSQIGFCKDAQNNLITFSRYTKKSMFYKGQIQVNTGVEIEGDLTTLSRNLQIEFESRGLVGAFKAFQLRFEANECK